MTFHYLYALKIIVMDEKQKQTASPLPMDNKPLVKKMPAGKYFWCACGRSKKETFCDGSHYKTGIRPVRVVLDDEQTVAWCMCKGTTTPPFCDGSHSAIDK